MERHYCLQKSFIDSDREKNSASNDSIFNGFDMDINDLLGQKLIFGPFKNVQDISYYSTNIENKYDIRDQYILFYQFIKTISGTKTKKFSRIPEGKPGTKN